MPMASVLFLVGSFSARNLMRGDRFSPFALGFEAFGWVAIFAFVTIYSIAPSALLNFTEWIGASTKTVLEPLFQGSPAWVQLSVELGFGAVLFFASAVGHSEFFGGWLAQETGVTAAAWEHLRRGGTGRAAAIPPDSSKAAVGADPALLEWR